MDKKTFAIGVMSIIATILFVGNLMPVQQAQAATSIKDRDYQLATAKSVKGGEVLYVIDNRTGFVAAFAWDNAARAFKPMAIESLTNLFK